uniref:Glycylpeptide N-tetradecanoyltransferase n=1 Tax=Steinernema glaseri TaxID=37863 RepID=A0A1I7XW09_9BILA
MKLLPALLALLATVIHAQQASKFWETQPVMKIGEVVTENTFIIPKVDVSKIRKQPYELPAGLKWDDVDVNNGRQREELYTLLSENYVEDNDHLFRFDYSSKFLQWALTPPGAQKQLNLGVRMKGKLVGFISAIPVQMKVYAKTVKMVEINFLCVHKQLRSKGMTPMLIREIARRVSLQGIMQAAYTAGVVIAKPAAKMSYWHRPLNIKNVVDVGYSRLASNFTLKQTMKLYKLPASTKTPRLVPMQKKHVKAAFDLLTRHLKGYDLAPLYTREEFAHFFLPRQGVVYSYVVEAGNKVSDFVSFYSLPSRVVNQQKKLKEAYSFYNVATSVKLSKLMNDALILAKKAGFDVFTALDVMENKSFLNELQFGMGDASLQYYFYNWKCPDIQPGRVGLVLP